MRDLPYRPFQPPPKASEWRWPEYYAEMPSRVTPWSAAMTTAAAPSQ